MDQTDFVLRTDRSHARKMKDRSLRHLDTANLADMTIQVVRATGVVMNSGDLAL